MPPPPPPPPPPSSVPNQHHRSGHYTRPTYPFPSTSAADATARPVVQPLHPSSSYPVPLPPTRHPSLSQSRRSFSQPLFSRLKNLQSSSSASLPTAPVPSSSSSTSPGSGFTAVKMTPAPLVLNDPPGQRTRREKERERSAEREGGERDNVSKMISSVKRHFGALRRAPTPVHEDYESALSAMRYGSLEAAAPPPTIEQIARGLASRTHRPHKRMITPSRSSLKRPSTAPSLTYSPTSLSPTSTSSPPDRALTPSSSSSSFLPSFSPSLRRLSRSSSAGTHTTFATDSVVGLGLGKGGSDEQLGRKAVRFGEQVMVVGRDGRRTSKSPHP